MWALLAAGAMAVTTGCDSGPTATVRPATTPTAAPSQTLSPSPSRPPAAGPVTAAEAAAAAEKINLTAADVPGFASSPAAPPDEASERAFTDFVNCLGGFKPVHDVSSADFSSGKLQLSSNVSVFTDEQTVRKDLAALAADKALGCTATYVTAGSGASAAPKVSRLSPAAAGADGTYGFSATQGDAVFQVLGFARGRTEVSLVLFAADGNVDTGKRDRLFGTLLQRGLAHAL